VPVVATQTSLTTLSRALDQLGDLLLHVQADGLDDPTPCTDWTLGDLADHVVASPQRFVTMLRGEEPDWSAPPEHREDGWAGAFRSAADDLMHLAHEAADGGGGMDPDWMTAEFAVHTWDLVHALGRSTAELDPEVAERGLAFMQANLQEGMRGEAFGPEQPAPADGDAYDAVAAFAGRTAAA
jgi:uncharacterized protein (TIGR03083 family)